MSGLARIYHAAGASVSGSDQTSSRTTDELLKEGIFVKVGQKHGQIHKATELVIYSSAIQESNPERIEATDLNIKQLSYPEAVGLLTRQFSTISICGTHGKTTTSGMLAASFLACGQDPTVLMGATTAELGNRNARYGTGKNLILESCEHFRNFLNYEPKNIIVTNIELDHLDYYKDSRDYIGAFKEFFDRLPANGLLIANGDDSGTLDATRKIGKKVIYYGSGHDNHYRIINRDLFYKGKKIFTLHLSVPGLHNVYNAAGVFALCHELNLDMSAAAKALMEYKGAGRRFEIKGYFGKTLVIDDYAHHPTEISATLHAVREKYGHGKKIICVFQPHQYSRTRFFLEDFSESFGAADHVIIPEIIRVRDSEEDVSRISAEMLVKKISEKHPSVSQGGELEETIKILREQAPKYDILITMGAGDVWKIADSLTNSGK